MFGLSLSLLPKTVQAGAQMHRDVVSEPRRVAASAGGGQNRLARGAGLSDRPGRDCNMQTTTQTCGRDFVFRNGRLLASVR
jgi:hypothetical protein